MADTAQLMDAIKGMTVLELSDFVKQLQEEFGVTAAAPAAAAPPAARPPLPLNPRPRPRSTSF